MPNTPLQMLFRGQNILGYKHYADDVVDMFVKKSIENGISVIRIFDALNDPRNLEQAIKSCKEYGGTCKRAYFGRLQARFRRNGQSSYAPRPYRNEG